VDWKRTACLTVLMISAGAKAAESTARFEPPAGKILLIVGQNVEEIQAYLGAAQVRPGGFMAYTSTQRMEGLDEPSNQGDGTQYAQKLVNDYPDTVLQIGLYIVDDCDHIAKGERDDAIDRLGDWIQATKRPVFLRIGYEFDGPHNHYPPQDYINAYRRLVNRFRDRGIRNVAYVWHSYASKISQPLDDWYPGDSYVDWVGISYFDQPQSQMLPAIQFAHEHQKPVMIAESSAWRVQTRWPNAWNLWFAPYFKFIDANNIKAVSYIGSDWDSLNQFSGQKWGDTRLQSNPEILRRWLQETSQDRYLKSSPDLFRQLGYEK